MGWLGTMGLPDSKKKEITERIRSLVLKHLKGGVSNDTRIICHNCGYARQLAGAVHYGRYRLCNDCALEYELAKAGGKVKNIESFVSSD